MTTALYNIGDEFEVISSFTFESKLFIKSRKGIVKEIIDDDWSNEIRYYIQWDFQGNGFHDCGGHCTSGYGWSVDSSVLEKNTQLILDTSRSTNPLPTDNRLRGIALKIIQLENKFKRYQELKKSGQLDTLNDEDIIEEEEDEWEDCDSNDYETVRG